VTIERKPESICSSAASVDLITIDRNVQRQRIALESSNCSGAAKNVKEEISKNSGGSRDTMSGELKGNNIDFYRASDRDTWPDRMRHFFTFPSRDPYSAPSHPLCEDENEISLEDDNEATDDEFHANNNNNVSIAENEEARVPQLLVLGTGCASPSPYRGSSGYALILPAKAVSSKNCKKSAAAENCTESNEDLVVAFEVGEGFCTQWNRYASGRPFSSIKAIWISHAHWDHYGGLANLLVCIHRDKMQQESERRGNCQSDLVSVRSRKRCRSITSDDNVAALCVTAPCVVAPLKVIKYLELVLDRPSKYFQGVLSDDAPAVANVFERLCFVGCNQCGLCIEERNHCPIAFWENVHVDHSCSQAYGFVMGLRSLSNLACNDSPFIFCFSGDSRPSWNLVQACRYHVARYKGCTGLDFLLHEATFDDSERQMSLAKKHSTVKEALRVGRDVNALRLLLTHFSQRYDRLPTIEEEASEQSSALQVGFALDGMLIPLLAM
jgi:ribonuclease BN (tRNA processing enzyme)